VCCTSVNNAAIATTNVIAAIAATNVTAIFEIQRQSRKIFVKS